MKTGPQGNGERLAFSLDGRHLFVSDTETLALYDIDHLDRPPEIISSHQSTQPKSITGIHVLDNSQLLLQKGGVTGELPAVYLFNLESRNSGLLWGGTGEVALAKMAASPRGRWAVLCPVDVRLFVWESTKQGVEAFEIALDDYPTALTFLMDNQHVGIGCAHGGVVIVDLVTRRVIQKLDQIGTSYVQAIAFHEMVNQC